MKHETEVTKVAAADLKKQLNERAALRWAAKNPQILAATVGGGDEQPEQPSYEENTDEVLAEFFSDTESSTAYEARCKCGWAANNPLPTKDSAEASAQAHIEAIYGPEA